MPSTDMRSPIDRTRSQTSGKKHTVRDEKWIQRQTDGGISDFTDPPILLCNAVLVWERNSLASGEHLGRTKERGVAVTLSHMMFISCENPHGERRGCGAICKGPFILANHKAGRKMKFAHFFKIAPLGTMCSNVEPTLTTSKTSQRRSRCQPRHLGNVPLPLARLKTSNPRLKAQLLSEANPHRSTHRLQHTLCALGSV